MWEAQGAQEGCPGERTFKKDQKDERRQAGRVVICLSISTLLKNPLCSPCISFKLGGSSALLPTSDQDFGAATLSNEDYKDYAFNQRLEQEANAAFLLEMAAVLHSLLVPST